MSCTTCGQTDFRPLREGDKIGVSYPHGLGDCSWFAHLIHLYVEHGAIVELDCNDDKSFVFAATGAIVNPQERTVPHPYEPCHNKYISKDASSYWDYNKTAQAMLTSRVVSPNLG